MAEARNVYLDERWKKAQEHIQAGNWEEALALLRALAEDYPDNARLQRMITDVELRASLAEETTERPKRQLPTIPRRAMTITVLAIVFLGLLITFYGGYQKYIVPAQATAAAQRAREQLYQEARAALAAGEYDRAIDLFSRLLAEAPDYPGAQEGLTEAKRRQVLAEKYDRAMKLLDEGKNEEALRLLMEIARESSNFRDVEKRIKQLEEEMAVEALFRQAEDAFANKDWPTAIDLYEEVRQRDSSYEKETVHERLAAAHLAYARQILTGGSEDAPDIALEHVRRSLFFNSRDETARDLRHKLTTFIRGRREFQQGNYREAVRQWISLYEREADFAGGLLARYLYRAYVELGKKSELAGDLPNAIHYYALAVELPVEDKTYAQERLNFLFVLITPTPTPTSTPTPTPTPTATPTPTVTPTPTATPTPTPKPLPLSAYPGWIAFKTDRRGQEEVWVMQPNGCCARPVADPENFEKIREKQQYAPNGKMRVFVEAPPGSKDKTNLYIWRLDVPANWEHKYLIVDNGSINYDPVFSPDSGWIAFVSQVTGGDEIWKVSSDFVNPKPPIRLTHNTWEWDKSPTWSPDGKYIAFWSNRVTGRKQIWIMNADGSNQHNISRNQYNDWDPVWLWPSYFK